MNARTTLKALLLAVALFVCASGVLVLGVLKACQGTARAYGDAKLVRRTNLMGTEELSLDSPQFSLAEQREFTFEFAGLPFAVLPNALIVSSPGYEDGPPGYLSSSLDISFEDRAGSRFYSRVVDLADLQRSSTGFWPSSLFLYEFGAEPGARSTYRIRVSVLRASRDRSDTAYLHAGHVGPATLELSDFQVGSTRGGVRERFGEPTRIQSFTKSGENIWGPIEEFWSEVPMGGEVEVWSYAVSGGSAELYFINDDDRLDGIGFAVKGAVYEAGPEEP